MANVALDEFADSVAFQAYGCPRPVIQKAIRNAAIRVCEESRIWVLEDSAEVGADGILDFSYPLGNAEMMEIERLLVDGQPLTPASAIDLDQDFPEWRFGNVPAGLPKFYASLDDDTLRLVPCQPCTANYVLRLKPSEKANDLPDFLYRRHKQTIQHGALAEILMQRGQEWFMPELAAVHENQFNIKLGRTQRLKAQGRQKAAMRTKSTFF